MPRGAAQGDDGLQDPIPPRSDERCKPVTFSQYRFSPLKLRGEGASKVQLNAVSFFCSAQNRFVNLANCTASNPGGNNPVHEGPDKILKSKSKRGKWLDFNKRPLIIHFRLPTQVTHFAFRTANDDNRRDPVRFALEGSVDGEKWQLLYEQDTEDYYVGRGKQYKERLTWSTWFCLEDRGESCELNEQLALRDRYLCRAESRGLASTCVPGKSFAVKIGYQWHYQLLAHLAQHHANSAELVKQLALKEEKNQEEYEWRMAHSKAPRCIYEGQSRVPCDSAPKRRKLENLFGTRGEKKVRDTATISEAFREMILLSNDVVRAFPARTEKKQTRNNRSNSDPCGVRNPPSPARIIEGELGEVGGEVDKEEGGIEEEPEIDADYEAEIHRFADNSPMQEILAVLGDTTTEERAKKLVAKRIVDTNPFPQDLTEMERRKQVEDLGFEGRTERWLWILCTCIAYPEEKENASKVRLDLFNVMLLKKESPWVCLFAVLRIVPELITDVLPEVMPFLGEDEGCGDLFHRSHDTLKDLLDKHWKAKRRLDTVFPLPLCVKLLEENATSYIAALALGALFGYLLKEADESQVSLACVLGEGYLKKSRKSRRWVTVACFLTSFILTKYCAEDAMQRLRHFPRSENLDAVGMTVPAHSNEVALCRFWRWLFARLGVQWQGAESLLTAKIQPTQPSQSQPTQSLPTPSQPSRASQLSPPRSQLLRSPMNTPATQGNSSRASATRTLQAWNMNNIMNDCKTFFLSGIPKVGVRAEFIAEALSKSATRKQVQAALNELHTQGVLFTYDESGTYYVTLEEERRIIATNLQDLEQKAFTFDAKVSSFSTLQNVGSDDPEGGFELILRGAEEGIQATRLNKVGPIRLLFSPINGMSKKWAEKWVEFDRAVIRVKSPLKKTIHDKCANYALQLTVDELTEVEILSHGISDAELGQRCQKMQLKKRVREGKHCEKIAAFHDQVLEHNDTLGDIVGEVRHYRVRDGPLERLTRTGEVYRPLQIRVAENAQNLLIFLVGNQAEKFTSLKSFEHVVCLKDARVYRPKDGSKNAVVAKEVDLLLPQDPRFLTLKRKLKEGSGNGGRPSKRRQTIIAGAFKIYNR